MMLLLWLVVLVMGVYGDVVVCGEDVVVGRSDWVIDDDTKKATNGILEQYVLSLPDSRNVTVRRFKNPAGYAFDTIVMREMNDVPGNSMNAPLHEEHSWFEGYAWTPLSCDRVHHLGWKFVSKNLILSLGGNTSQDTFYLIVLSQIRYVDASKKWTYVWNPTTRSFVSQTRGGGEEGGVYHSSRSSLARQDRRGSKWREL